MHSPSKHSTSTSTKPLAFIFITTILCFISLSCSNQYPDSTPEKLLSGEKSRLGSTPPSCHNKCNQCRPCMAVQVPTPPSPLRVQPSPSAITSFDPSSPGDNYSNYKPLSWKCRCNNHLYNP